MITEAQVDALISASASKLESMRASIREAGSALVAFSGGVDSAFVLKIAVEQLGDKAVALMALSPSVAPDEQREAAELAGKLGARFITMSSHELERAGYVENSNQRCYHCKTELYSLCEVKRKELGLAVVLDGFNADDTKDHRPGHRAAREHEVRSPLAAAGLTKNEIRAWSQQLGLPTWDKPQMACLASRIPYGTSVTNERLLLIGRAESAIRRLGLKQFRVRYHNEIARLEVAAEEYEHAMRADFRDAANRELKALGFSFVVLDLEPFRSGRMNDAVGVQKSALALPVIS